MRRISTAFKKEKPQTESLPRPDSVREPPPAPSSAETWRVDESFVEQSSRMVPASPDDVDDTTRAIFIAKVFKGDEWVDFDYVEYGLGCALDVFPTNATFASYKWVFVSC